MTEIESFSEVKQVPISLHFLKSLLLLPIPKKKHIQKNIYRLKMVKKINFVPMTFLSF